jgi:diadenosine tetraphosphate (Ap4A) HIT family hydrolase
MTFELDHRIKNDGVLLAESGSYLLNLVNDSRYVWLVLVPKEGNARDVYDLEESQQVELTLISNRIGKLIMREFDGDKFNVASLGNMVPQLHIHLIVRTEGDAAWPGPIWGVGKAVPYDEKLLQTTVSRLQGVTALLK